MDEGKRLSREAKDGETLVGGFIRARQDESPLLVETPRPDELAKAVLPHPRPWTLLPRRRRTKIATMGLSRDILNRADPAYKRMMLLANSYRKVRASELANMHGCVSSGASALLASASLALAASRFLYEKVAETGEIALLKQAASLGDSARQSELAAWEMSAREGAAKRKLDASKAGLPWLLTDQQAKPGRKTNEDRQLLTTTSVVSQRGLTIDEVLNSPKE